MQAGGHPFAVSTNVRFNYTTNFEGKLVGAGGGAPEFGVGPKEVEVELPYGFVGNPQTTPKCPLESLREGETECPAAAVGYIKFDYTTGAIVPGEPGEANFTGATSLIYDVEPPPGHPAAFGFVAPSGHLPFLIYPQLRSDGDYGLTVGSEAAGPLRAAEITFCSYGAEGPENGQHCKPASSEQKPFLSNPAQCLEPPAKPPSEGGVAPEGLLSTIHATPYPGTGPGGEASMRVYLNGPSGARADIGPKRGEKPTPASPGAFSRLTGCEMLTEQFKGEVSKLRRTTLELKPPEAGEGGTSLPDQPSAITLHLRPPQEVTISGGVKAAAPALKNLTMKLPPGLSLSPASAAPGQTSAEGLHACTNEQFGLGSSVEPTPPANCPLTSQIGTVEVFSPLLPKEADGSAPLKGALYVAAPECSPCSAADAEDGRLFRLFLQLRDPQAGVTVKLHGTANVNAATGEVSTSFEDQPQLPFEELVLQAQGRPARAAGHERSLRRLHDDRRADPLERERPRGRERNRGHALLLQHRLPVVLPL